MPTGPKCPRCRTQRYDWCSYFCPQCGQHNDDLYRREHQQPDAAKTMTRRDILREYAKAGMRYSRRECLWQSRH